MSDIKKQGEDFIDIQELFWLFLRRWQWFVCSIVICLVIAFTYTVITPPTYTRSASILIKDNDNRGGASSGMESFADMGLFKQNTDAQSEVYLLKSPQLMENVIERLNIDYNYRIKFKGVRFVDLYNGTPVVVKLDSINKSSELSFDIALLPSKKISLSNFIMDKEPLDFSIDGHISEILTTPCGKISVHPTVSYLPAYINETILFSKQSIKTLAKGYSKALMVSIPEKDVPVISLSFIDSNTQRAEDVLATVISVYNENWVKDKNQITSSTSKFITERLSVIEDELGNVDNDISTFKSDNLIPDVTAVSQLYLTQSGTNTTQLTALQNQLSMARYIRAYMNHEGTDKNQLIPANTGIDNTAIENQIDKFNTILLQKNNLIANSSEQNPVVADMVKSLNSMRVMILRSIDDYVSTLNIQINNSKQQQSSTNRKIASNPNQAKYLLSVERQQKVKEALYLFLLQKREENELSQTFTAYNTKIINLPDGDEIPTAPRRNILLLAALVIGVLLPAITLFIKESLDTIVREKKDLDSLDIPFVGEIPRLDKPKKRRLFGKKVEEPAEVMVVVEHQNRNIINEAFRSIRTNIDFMCPKTDKGIVIMTTSLNPGSGKTFTSINNALSMVMKGARTIIIDVDLRRASLSSVVDSPKKGISNYLNGSVNNIDDLIIKGALNSSLDFLPVGKIPPNPSELLLGERFSALIETFKDKYDYIFLDCPPITLVTDTSIIAHTADLTIFVVRAGLLDKRALPDIGQAYKSGHLKNMAIILNGIDLSSSKYGYRRYGYYRYGYGEND